MKIFVTGGLGVIGSYFAYKAHECGNEITVLDACEEPRNEWIAKNLLPNIEIRRERLEKADLSSIDGYDLILHAAAYTGIPSSAENSDDDWTSNVDATKNLVDQVKSFKIKPNIVVLSSVKPYKIDDLSVHLMDKRYSWKVGVSVDENFPMDPDEPYAASKLAQSAYCISQARTFDLPMMVFRCSNLYGPAPCHGPRHGWLTWFCISTAIGRPIIVQGNGYQSRDMLHADDVYNAVMAANLHMPEIRGEVYNIGGGKNNVISVKEAAEYCEKIGAKIKTGPGRKFEDMAFVTNFDKFQKKTEWSPNINILQGMQHLYDWAKQNKDDLLKMYEGI